MAPFWDDVDIRQAGNIFYESHNSFTGNEASLNLIAQVSQYISGETGESFFGSWLLVVQWDQVHPWPHGEVNPPPIFLLFFPDYTEVSECVLQGRGSTEA